MKAINDIIVKIDNEYTDEIKTKSGLVLSNGSLNQVKDTIRSGIVVSLPDCIDDDLVVGDELFFHHSIVHQTIWDEEFGVRLSTHCVDYKNKIYKVPVDKTWPMYFGRKRDGGSFKSLGRCNFLKPIMKRNESEIVDSPNEGENDELKAEMVYPSEMMSNSGVKAGDVVGFIKNAEYSFKIDGEVYFRMFDEWLDCVYESQ